MSATAAPYVPFASQVSRTSGPQLAFAVIHLVVGCYLLLLGRRTWRNTCAVSLGLAFELVTFAVAVNTIGVNGLNRSFTASNNDLALFGLVAGLGLAGFLLSMLLPQRMYAGWWPGYLFLGGLAGLSVGFGIIILGSGEGMLISSIAGRWVLSGVLAVIGVTAVMATRWRGAMVASCLIGSFLLAVGIDLIVNANKASSLGLRKMLDYSDLHATALRSYNPPLSMRLLIGLSWALALFFAVIQEFAYRDRPFLQLQRHQSIFGWRSYLPFTSQSQASRKGVHETDLEKDGITSAAGEALVTHDHSAGIGARSVHSQHDSSPHSVHTLPSEYADDSEIRRLTANYERALAVLGDENVGYATTTTGTGTGTDAANIPIYYRPGPVHLDASGSSSPSPSPVHEQDRLLPIPLADPAGQPELAEIQRRTVPHGPRAPQQQSQLRANAEELRRTEWDRGTTYSVPMTNFTASEYGDRDMRRPPTWVGDLPWHPDMLKGELDPATLPQHPPTTNPDEEVLQQQPISPSPKKGSAPPMRVAVLPSQRDPRASEEAAEEGYEVVQMYEVPSRASPTQRPVPSISQPQSMQAYASRPISRTNNSFERGGIAPALLGRLSPQQSYQNTSSSGNGNRATIPKTVRRGSRDQNMFPADDDLPEHSHSPLRTGFNAEPLVAGEAPAGHSRLNTSATAVEGYGAFQDAGNNDEDQDGAYDVASSHASYSLSNFRQSKRKQLAANKLAEEDDLRPVTQSDLTPMLQSMPSPARPILVHKNSPGMQSAMASLTGTGTATESVAQSETTVRPGEEQRRSMEMYATQGQTGRSAGDATPSPRESGEAEGDRRVRFNEAPGTVGRRRLRDRLLGRQSS